ncbi:MAG: hypothetical protein WC423_01380 [Vulcanimicrobiota bacterium]
MHVLTVHGVNTTKDSWQDHISQVFADQEVAYTAYHDRVYGEKTIVDTLQVGKFGPIIRAIRETSNIGALLTRDSGFRAFLDQRVNAFVRFYCQRHQSTAPPVVIAHSFGSLVVSKALEKYPYIIFDSLILLGAVVPRSFNWERIVTRGQVRLIRNEMAEKDTVVQALRANIWWLRNLFDIHIGSCGLPPGFKKEIPQLTQVVFPDFEHSDYHTAEGHARQYWLEFVLNNTLSAVIKSGNRNAFDIAFGPKIRSLIADTYSRQYREVLEFDLLESIYQYAKEPIINAYQKKEQGLSDELFLVQRIANLVNLLKQRS